MTPLALLNYHQGYSSYHAKLFDSYRSQKTNSVRPVALEIWNFWTLVQYPMTPGLQGAENGPMSAYFPDHPLIPKNACPFVGAELKTIFVPTKLNPEDPVGSGS